MWQKCNYIFDYEACWQRRSRIPRHIYYPRPVIRPCALGPDQETSWAPLKSFGPGCCRTLEIQGCRGGGPACLSPATARPRPQDPDRPQMSPSMGVRCRYFGDD